MSGSYPKNTRAAETERDGSSHGTHFEILPGTAYLFFVVMGVLLGAGGYDVVQAQAVGQWEAHTGMRQVRDISAGTSRVWAATRGGVFSFNPSTGEITRFTTVEGLHAIDVQALIYDETRRAVWIGYTDGVVDRLDVETGDIEAFHDIARTSRFSNPSVHTFTVRGDSLLVGTAFGLVVFDTRAGEVRDSYVRFGSEAVSAAVYDIAVAPAEGDSAPGYWLATDQGLASARLSHPNLRDPAAWTLEKMPVSGGGAATAVAFFDGSIYVGTRKGGFVRRDTNTYDRVWSSDREVRAMFRIDDRLAALFPFSLRLIDRNDQTQVTDIGDYGNYQRLARDAEGRFWLADGDRGIAAFGQLPFGGRVDEFTHAVIPEGPYHNLFGELIVDAEQTLWAATSGGSGTGFYRLQEGTWTNYIGRFFPELQGRAGFDRIHVDQPGSAWTGSAGHGLVHLKPDGTLRPYDQGNTPLAPAPGTDDYLRIGGIGSDSDGVIWVTNLFAAPHLVAFTPEGTWQGLNGLTDKANSGSVLYNRIFVDSHDQKWIDIRSTSNANEGEGLMIVDTGADPLDTADDRARIIEEGGLNAGLPHRTVTAIAEDESGRVWIGTERGLAFFGAPEFVLDPTNPARPQWPVSGGTVLLQDLFVQDIAVDPADQKWLATTEGAWLLNSAGTEVLRHLTTENSPLFSDNVVSVAVNRHNGVVYFATSQGLLSMGGEAIEPTQDPEELHVYPNPVQIRSASSAPEVTIEGLMAQAEVRVVTPDGRLVRELSVSGGRAIWDVTDDDGDFVPAGVYLVVAAGRSGGGSAYGKVAVVR